MNMLKGIVELGWEVLWKNLAMCLNFRSETALNCAKKVTDHHKGCTMCRIVREAVTKELIVPFVRQELSSGNPNLTPSEFLDHLWGAYAIPLALSVVHRPSSVVCRLCPP